MESSGSDIPKSICEAVVKLDAELVRELTRKAIDKGVSPALIVSEGLSKGMRRVGELFQKAEIFLPELFVCADAYYAGLQLLKPLLQTEPPETIGTMLIGTIYGDIHSVGKDVAIPVFQSAGLEVIDLGVAVPDEKFVEAVKEYHPEIVGLGTYMSSTFMHTSSVVEALRKAGLRDSVRVICGGPAVDPGTARKLGADDASDDAWLAVEKIKSLLASLNS